MTEGNGPSYAVEMSQQIKARVKKLHLDEAQKGKGNLFITALRQIIMRLHQNPLDFGEALYRLPALNLLVKHGVIGRLVVSFAVHDEKPLVFIGDFKTLS